MGCLTTTLRRCLLTESGSVSVGVCCCVVFLFGLLLLAVSFHPGQIFPPRLGCRSFGRSPERATNKKKEEDVAGFVVGFIVCDVCDRRQVSGKNGRAGGNFSYSLQGWENLNTK
jgi:hypothetical protein